ncbi:MAG: J domain-containing protein [Desulfobacterales bacterium]|nr:J domain-containing protein [Desulfobacterales bacterium]
MISLSPYTTIELFDACRILFGPDIQISIEFLKYLRPSGVKDAFWQKARETHPDRAVVLGKDVFQMTEEFKQIASAYEKLISVISEQGFIYAQNQHQPYHSTSVKPKHQSHQSHQSDHYYQGALPKRELLFGQFLYYSGHVSWRTLIDTIVKQKKNRPLIGQLAQQWGLITPTDIRYILSLRESKEKFGDCAIRTGYLNHLNIIALLGKQRRMQRPIGEYFIEKGINNLLIHEMLTKQHQHNQRIITKTTY